MNTTDLHSDKPDIEGPAQDQLRASRRRAMLKGLGKGGTLLAAVAPMTSFAVGRVKTTEGTQCTVSGQMSAVMSSGASAQACAAYHPTHFFDAELVAISSFPDGNFRTRLVDAKVLSYTARADGDYFKVDADNVRKLTPANRPTNYNTVDLKMVGIFSNYSPTGHRVLRVLHGRSDSAAAYFVAAFFSSALQTWPVNSEKVPFTADDVQSHWGAATQGSAEQLYRLVCVVENDPTKLG